MRSAERQAANDEKLQGTHSSALLQTSWMPQTKLLRVCTETCREDASSLAIFLYSMVNYPPLNALSGELETAPLTSWRSPALLDVGTLLPPAMIPEVGGNCWMVMSLVTHFALVLTSSYGV